jgi:hypothetical protein
VGLKKQPNIKIIEQNGDNFIESPHQYTSRILLGFRKDKCSKTIPFNM